MIKPTSLSQKRANDLNTLRLLVGFLGQKKCNTWWDCDFLDNVGLRFLEVTFPRTFRKAAFRSTNEAAAAVHDHALGKIGCYHLFRLPFQIDVALETAVDALDWDEALPMLQSHDAALAGIQRLAGTLITSPRGPVQIGVEDRILTSSSVEELAAHYHSAFHQGIKCFPYFGAKNHGR